MPLTPRSFACAETEVERVAAVPAGVELLAIAPGDADVVDDDALADRRFLAVADDQVVDDELGGRFALGSGDDGFVGHGPQR
jgi:hypothetical protein